MPVLTCCGSLEALVFGYMNGESVSTNSRSNGNVPSSNSLRTPVSDLSWKIHQHRSFVIIKNAKTMEYLAEVASESNIVATFDVFERFLSGAHKASHNYLCHFRKPIRQSHSIGCRWSCFIILTSWANPEHQSVLIVREWGVVYPVPWREEFVFRKFDAVHLARKSLADSPGRMAR